MEIKQVNPVSEYQFEISVTGVRATILGNLLGFAVILISALDNVFSNPFALFCLITGSLILVINAFYNWRNFELNLLIVVIYLLIYFVELFMIGIPNQTIGFTRKMSKGILLELIMFTVPYVYSMMRVALIIPLIQIYFASKKVN